jgi:HlyD family secretion protein
MKKIKHFIIKRKVISGIIILFLLLIGYSVYAKYNSNNGVTSYIFAKAETKDIVTTITGTGQVSASNQIDIKSKVSGDIIYLNKEINGTNITKGTLIAKIDARDAEIALENAKIAYEKLVKPADQSTLLQNVSNLNDALANNQKSYEDGFNAVTDSLVDFPPIINGLNSMFYDTNGYLKSENIRNLGVIALNYQGQAGMSFDRAKVKYEQFLSQYKNLSRNDATTTIESFVNDAYLVARNISEAVKSAQNAIEYARKQKSDTSGDTAASNITTWTSSINSTLTSLLNARTAISSSMQNIVQRNVELNELVMGADELDIRSQLLNLRQKEYDYQNYFIRAPFDGVLAKIAIKSTDSVSNGTVIGTMVSSQKIHYTSISKFSIL